MSAVLIDYKLFHYFTLSKLSLKQLWIIKAFDRAYNATEDTTTTIYAKSAEMETLLDILKKESETTIKWFKQNKIILSPDKFQAVVLGRQMQKEKMNLTINGAETKAQNSVTLLRVEIDNELNFNNHISNISKKAENKINAISRTHDFLGQKKKGALVFTQILTITH